VPSRAHRSPAQRFVTVDTPLLRTRDACIEPVICAKNLRQQVRQFSPTGKSANWRQVKFACAPEQGVFSADSADFRLKAACGNLLPAAPSNESRHIE
jgi:hypothetical protein